MDLAWSPFLSGRLIAQTWGTSESESLSEHLLYLTYRCVQLVLERHQLHAAWLVHWSRSHLPHRGSNSHHRRCQVEVLPVHLWSQTCALYLLHLHQRFSRPGATFQGTRAEVDHRYISLTGMGEDRWVHGYGVRTYLSSRAVEHGRHAVHDSCSFFEGR